MVTLHDCNCERQKLIMKALQTTSFNVTENGTRTCDIFAVFTDKKIMLMTNVFGKEALLSFDPIPQTTKYPQNGVSPFGVHCAMALVSAPL